MLRLILGTGIRMMLVGAALGLIGAVALARIISVSLPGVAINDPLPVSAAAALLVGVSVVACYLPARRATKVDPLVAMRAE